MPKTVLARHKHTGATYRVSEAALEHPVLGKHLEPADKPAAPEPEPTQQTSPAAGWGVEEEPFVGTHQTPVAGDRKE